MTSLYGILEHPIFLSALFSWFGAQFMKAVIKVFTREPGPRGELLLTLFWTTGGMPSSHSAVVSSLAAAIGLTEGFESSIFIMAAFYAVLTIRDALGVRRSAGLQAAAINKLNRAVQERGEAETDPVKEVHGHTVSEVTVGILLGIFIALAFCRL